MWVCTSTFPHVQDVEVDDAVIEGGFCSTVSVEEADTLRREDMVMVSSPSEFHFGSKTFGGILSHTHASTRVPLCMHSYRIRIQGIYIICVHVP